MSFLDRIAECNAHDLGEFTPFTVAQRRVGWVRHGLAARLAAHHPELRLGPQALALDDGLADPAARSAAMDGVVRAMEREGLVTGRRDEFYPVAAHVGAPALLQIERAAVPAFGIAACGVHMTGFVRKPDGIHIWVPRRARTKSTYPGMLDNTVAGGQPVGIGIFENLIKECAEEASIPEALARRALPAGSVSYCMAAADGLKPDIQFCFDLELPADFVPRPADGEMERYELWPAARVMATVRDTRDFKFNCNLVLIDFFVRHGLVDPGRGDYLDIVAGLRR
jgi:hypothetical protein